MGSLDRVIFFSKRDLMKNPMLEKAEKLLEKSHDLSSMNLNMLLEYHHIHQYFQNDLFLDRWTTQQRSAYIQIVKNAIVAIRTFILNVSPENIIVEVKNLEFNNKENFWELYQYFELYKRIDRKIFVEILSVHPHHIRYILTLKKIVEYYNVELRSFLLTYEESAELLLSHYEEKMAEPSNYYFPKSISETDKQEIVIKYLNSPKPNLNYVES